MIFLKDLIREAVSRLGAEVPYVELEVPRDEKFGDISTPVAMTLARPLRRAPRQIAEEIAGSLEEDPAIQSVDVAGPGFLNFRISTDFLLKELERVLRHGPDCLVPEPPERRKVQIEFVSANPTGPLHLGHGRGAAVGAALANLLQRGGYEVEKEFYINDAGRQVRLLGESIYARYQERFGKEYPFPEDGYKGDYISELAGRIAEEVGEKYIGISFDEAGGFFIERGTREMLDTIRTDLETFGVVFDRWQSEKLLYTEGLVKKCLDGLRSEGKLYEKDGALWFRASDYGDDKDRVVVKSDGSHTYFASDIAYHWYKIQRGFDELIDIWGADHHGYIPRMKAVIRALGEDEGKLSVILVQMVSLLRGGKPVQMSKRSGEFITLREVIEEVGADTTKFIFLTRKADSHLEFDIEVAKKESSENPVYYVQYAYARIQSIYRKAAEQGIGLEDIPFDAIMYLKEPEEMRLLKKILLYPLIFEGAFRAREPHRITFYLQELAGLFHPYYNTHRVLSDDAGLTGARLLLLRAVELVLREALSVLGISAPERM